MAEGPWTSQVLCRYYMHGVCRENERCRYSHDLKAKPSNVCRYYQLGKCAYGDRCRYEHKKQNNNQNKSGEPPPRFMAPKPVILPRDDGATSPGTLTLLHKKEQSADSGYGELDESNTSQEPSTSQLVNRPDQWVKAAEFVPGKPWKTSTPLSYLEAAQSGREGEKELQPKSLTTELVNPGELCPYAACGQCWYEEGSCPYIHGNMCDMCGKQALHPNDEEQRKKHIEDCLAEHEKAMKKSFAVQRSMNKTCGICMDVVVEKQPTTDARFGILSNCNHVYCLACIRKWRAAKQFENKLVRACPECRVKSDFVTPSQYWVEDKDEKLQLISGYKTALSEKPCKYFDQGRGECPFNNNCFYRHAYPDGRIASPQPIRPRKRQNADGDLDSVQTLLLWDFLDEHRAQIELDLDDLAEQLEALLRRAHLYDSSSDDDLSDFEGFL